MCACHRRTAAKDDLQIVDEQQLPDHARIFTNTTPIANPFRIAARRLQGATNPACKDFIDDANGDLAATGVTCEQVLLLGCDSDLHISEPQLPEGSLVSLICPVSCNNCHRSGMATWIETAVECPWDRLDGAQRYSIGLACGVLFIHEPLKTFVLVHCYRRPPRRNEHRVLW